MIRTQIQLDDKSYHILREHASKRHVSMAACIRTAIERFLAEADEQIDDLSDIAGRFRPLPADNLKPHDRDWSDAIMRQHGGGA